MKRVEWLFELLMDLFRRGALPAEQEMVNVEWGWRISC